MAIPKMVKLMAQFDAGQSDHHEKISKNDLNVALNNKRKRCWMISSFHFNIAHRQITNFSIR